MSRFSRLLQQYSPAHFTPPNPFTIELGSAHTRFAEQGKVFFHQPTTLVVQQETQDVIAIGQEAAQYIGKTPHRLQVVWPIRQGQVSAVVPTQQFVTGALQETGRLNPTIWPFFSSPITVVVPARATEVQQDILRTVFRSVQLKPTFVTKMQIFARRFAPQAGVVVIDIGSMTTECGIVGNGQVIAERTVLLGGEDITQEILMHIRQAHQAEVGWLTAEQVKRETARVSSVAGAVPAARTVIRGRDLLTNLPKTFTVSGEIFDVSIERWLSKVLREIHTFCQDVPAEILAQALSNGIYLTGGGSLLAGVAEYLSKQLSAEVVHSRTPLIDTVKVSEEKS